jgi:hypothetical protein
VRSKPQEFERNFQREGSLKGYIVKLTDDTNDFYFSDIDMQIGSVHVYPLLEPSNSNCKMSEMIDPLKKNWAVSSMSIKLLNAKYRKDSSGNRIELIDDLADIETRDATVYLFAGSNVDNLDDCLLHYVGIVRDPPIYDGKYIFVRLVDKGTTIHKILPETTLGDVYDGSVFPEIARRKSTHRKIPIAYGKYTFTGDENQHFYREGSGLAHGEAIDGAFPPFCVFANHPCYSFSRMFIKDSGIPDPARFYDPSLNANDGGYCHGKGGKPSGVSPIVIGFVHAINADDEEYSETSPYNSPVDYWKVYDAKAGWGILEDNVYDYGTSMRGMGTWGMNLASWIRAMIDDELLYQFTCEMQLNNRNITDPQTFRMWLVDIHNNTKITATLFNLADVTTWQTTGNLKDLIGTNIPSGVQIEIVQASGGDNVVNNYDMVWVYSIRYKVSYKIKTIDITLGQLDGKMYGAWITGRSSNYADGYVIEDPAGIIEDLHRSYMDLSSSDIDEGSFVDAENTSVNMTVNLHHDNQIHTRKLIKQICEQSTFCYIYSATGVARLIPLVSEPASVERNIFYSWIVDNSTKIIKSNFIVNRMNLKSHRLHEYDDIYWDSDTHNNVTSQSEYNKIHIYDAKWPNLYKTSADHVARHLIRAADGSINDDDGIWANRHIIISFSTRDFICADLEVGDWISIDAESCDPIFKCYGESWSGKKLMIIEMAQQKNRTDIKAMELF